jgi:uncharacterized membrane protein
VRLRTREDEGSILPLVAGFLALGLALALVVAAASSLYLERKRLYTVADAAALAAAQDFALDEVSVQDGRVRAQLTDAGVEDAVREYLTSAPPTLDGLALEAATSPDGQSAAVTLSAVWRPPVGGALVPDGIRLEVTSTARTAFR